MLSNVPVAANATGPRDAERLVAAYPDHLAKLDGQSIVWRDGTRMLVEDSARPKSLDDLFARPDLKDIFHWPYPKGRHGVPPADGADPGRIRHAPFFAKMYGDCTKGEVAKHLVDVPWLPSRGGGIFKVTRINGVAEKVRKISEELEKLPARFTTFLVPAAGTYHCRVIAGTNRQSAHGYGIAIDIAIKHAHYWRWSKPNANGVRAYRNAVPWEIVEVFERHGFIWGGKWYHFDTMHFEYRPELLK